MIALDNTDLTKSKNRAGMNKFRALVKLKKSKYKQKLELLYIHSHQNSGNLLRAVKLHIEHLR
jgi:acyl CoA:acetate/3-ketoacid CoA transferase alpha subunit